MATAVKATDAKAVDAKATEDTAVKATDAKASATPAATVETVTLTSAVKNGTMVINGHSYTIKNYKLDVNSEDVAFAKKHIAMGG